MNYFKNYLNKTNIVHLYMNKNNITAFLNVCDVYETDIKDTQKYVKDFKNNLNFTSFLFIMSSIFIGYGIIFNILLLELVLITLRFSFECGKQHIINNKYMAIKPYTLVSAWNL